MFEVFSIYFSKKRSWLVQYGWMARYFSLRESPTSCLRFYSKNCSVKKPENGQKNPLIFLNLTGLTLLSVHAILKAKGKFT